MKFTTIKLEGEILSSEIIEKINKGDVEGQSPADFSFDKKTAVKDEIISTWAEASSLWKAYKHRMDRVSEDDMGTTVTRNIFIVPFLSLLGFELQLSGAETLNGKSYAISHRDTRLDSLPVIVMGFKDSLDQKRNDGGPRMSPHGLMQEYLNLTEHLYGIITNGLQMRVLRDSSRLIRQSYIEFDLERMFEEEQYSDFAVMYRLIHSTRFPVKKESADSCIFEKYHQDALDSGARIREGLSNAMEKSITLLGNGFLNHPDSIELRELVTARDDTAIQYYQNLLRVLYRLLFLMVIEERNLIFSNEAKESNRKIYYNYYSVNRLRKLSERSHSFQEKHCDIWLSLLNTFELFNEEKKGNVIEIEPLGGLFNDNAIGTLRRCSIDNKTMLECFGLLNFFRNSDTGLRVKVNYASLNVEEFGSVYEGMLDFHPNISNLGSRYTFKLVAGTERKTTASYYTPEDLVVELIKSALVPVIDERLSGIISKKQDYSKISIEERKNLETKLLDVKICDPACGSGHFLLGGARYMGKLLARLRTGEDEPSPSEINRAKRDVISHCIYGVDKNPMAVELCKVALWLEGHSAGSPLSFIDHHVRCGDSLVGVMNIEEIKTNGIPDNAFKPITGDSREISSNLKKVNAKHVGYDHTASLFAEGPVDMSGLEEEFKKLDLLKDDSIDLQKAKEEQYKKIKSDGGLWSKTETLCNLWIAAFFIQHTEINKNNKRLITNDEFFRYLNGEQIANSYIASANALASELKFFHWELEFPEVFAKGGFACVLGNPPWDMIELNEKDFFTKFNLQIANAPTNTQRGKLIADLENNNPVLYSQFIFAKRAIYAIRKFIQYSSRFTFSSEGRINLYPIFVELAPSLLNKEGRAGLIVPSAISMDAYNANLFGWLIKNNYIESLFDFENKLGIFPSVHRMYRFCLFTIAKNSKLNKSIEFRYLCRRVEDIRNKMKVISLSMIDIETFSPNTYAPPIFLTQEDGKIAKKIYSQFGVLHNNQVKKNLWNVSIQRMLSLSDPGGYFSKFAELSSDERNSMAWTRLYSGKVIYQYNHRYANYSDDDWHDVEENQILNPSFEVETEYYVKSEEVVKRLSEKPVNKWLLCYRDITNATNERTVISSIISYSGCDTTCRNIYLYDADVFETSCFLANLNSLVFDYLARQKIIGTHLNASVFEQLPVIKPDLYTRQNIDYILPRVLELVYTAWDIKAYADDVWNASDGLTKDLLRSQWKSNEITTGGHSSSSIDRETDNDGIPLPPFKWDNDRRDIIRTEIDAYYAKLYNLNKDELRFILDPTDIYGSDFPGETFRVLKGKEIRKYGEYRTRRLVLEAWDRLWG